MMGTPRNDPAAYTRRVNAKNFARAGGHTYRALRSDGNADLEFGYSGVKTAFNGSNNGARHGSARCGQREPKRSSGEVE